MFSISEMAVRAMIYYIYTGILNCNCLTVTFIPFNYHHITQEHYFFRKQKSKQMARYEYRRRADYFAAVLIYRCQNGCEPFYIGNHFRGVSYYYFTRRSQYVIVLKSILMFLNCLVCTKAQFYGILSAKT